MGLDNETRRWDPEKNLRGDGALGAVDRKGSIID
jgi:hypothetical protein